MMIRRFMAKLADVANMGLLNRPRVRRSILSAAVILFLAGIAVALANHPVDWKSLDWRSVALVFAVAVPATVVLNAIDYMLSARLIGRSVRLRDALEVTIVGSAANMLPLPGATMVRVAGLRAAGAGYREGLSSTLLIAVIWLAVTLSYVGTWLVFSAYLWHGLALLCGGLAILAAGMVAAFRICKDRTTPVWVLFLKVAMVLTDATRIWLCLASIGAVATFAQASTLVVASFLGSAISVVPAGLGIRETISAAIGPLVGLTAAASFLATSLNRLLGLCAVMPLALWLAFGASSSRSAKRAEAAR